MENNILNKPKIVETRLICGTLAATIMGTASSPYLNQEESMFPKVNPFFCRASLLEMLTANILKFTILKRDPRAKPLAIDSHPKKSEKEATKSTQMKALFIIAIWNCV